MSDTSENTAPEPYDKDLVRKILLGGVTTEQPNELGIPVSSLEPPASAEPDTK